MSGSIALTCKALIRTCSIGTDRAQPLKSRQIVWINQFGLLGAAATSPYVLFYLVYDYELLPLAIVNLVFIGTYILVLYANHIRRPVTARNIGLVTLYTQQFVSAAFLGTGAGVHLYYFTLSGVMYFVFSRTRSQGAAMLVALAAVLYLVCEFAFNPGLVELPGEVLNAFHVTSVVGAVGLSGLGSYLVRREIENSEIALTRLRDIEEQQRLDARYAAALRAANQHLEQRVEQRTAELSRQAEKLQQTNHALMRSNSELQQFAHIVSHDLNSPLRRLGEFIRVLHVEHAASLNEEARAWIRRSMQATERMQALTRDLLTYSRIDSDAGAFRLVDLRAAFEAAVCRLDPAIRSSGAEITCGDLPVVMGDYSQLVLLLENLIGNAIKYRSHEQPRIHLCAEYVESDWRFSVRDNGVGIDPKYHDRIFNIFQRANNQQGSTGAGIGLAVCRRVVHRHDGRIWVESRIGRGSCFYFTLPALNGSTNTARGENNVQQQIMPFPSNVYPFRSTADGQQAPPASHKETIEIDTLVSQL